MSRKIAIPFILFVLMMTACEPKRAAFEINGSPDPLFYGYCGTPTLVFKVTGPGEGLKINGIIVAYQLFNGDGLKLKSGSLSLEPSPGDPSVTYTGSVTFKIASFPGMPTAPEDAIVYFGEGRVEFAATVDAVDLSPTGGATYFVTSIKSVRVIPCPPTATVPPPPGKKPTEAPGLCPTCASPTWPSPGALAPTAMFTPTATPTATLTPTIAPTIRPTKQRIPTSCGPNGCPP